MSGDDCVIEAKSARRQGRLADATALYVEAAESFLAEHDLARWAHALRHAAELAIKAGDTAAGLRDAQAVVEYYRSSPPTTLEMANALRVDALAEAAAGATEKAKQHWSEARGLYADAGVADGVAEADRHVATLAIA
jgi:tetratricopeptide (TPR) repeat protein